MKIFLLLFTACIASFALGIQISPSKVSAAQQCCTTSQGFQRCVTCSNALCTKITNCDNWQASCEVPNNCPGGTKACGNCPTTCDPNAWGDCSASCGGGTQTNACGTSRACNTQSCSTPPGVPPVPPTPPSAPQTIPLTLTGSCNNGAFIVNSTGAGGNWNGSGHVIYWISAYFNNVTTNPAMTAPATPSGGGITAGSGGDLMVTVVNTSTQPQVLSAGGMTATYTGSPGTNANNWSNIAFTLAGTPAGSYAVTIEYYTLWYPPSQPATAAVVGRGYYTANPCCAPTAPAAATLVSPDNGSTITTTNSASLAYNLNGWGTGCPANSNTYGVYVSTNGVDYVDYGQVNTLNGLSPNTTYWWFVRKWNGSLAINSVVWTFKTADLPTLTSPGLTMADTCGRGTTGRVGSPNVTNPISLRVNLTSGKPIAYYDVMFAMIPRSVTGNANSIDVTTGTNMANNANSFVLDINGNVPGSQTYFRNAAGIASGPVSTGNLAHPGGYATAMNVGSATRAVWSGNTATIDYQVRLENTFGSNVTNNPTGIWDIYSIAYVSHTDGTATWNTSNASFTKITSWKVDMISPSASVAGPIHNPDGTFNISYGAADNLGIIDVVNYITRGDSSLTLRDNTISQDLAFTFAPNIHRGSLTTSNYLTSPTRNYRDTSSEGGGQFNFRLDALDEGCNFTSSNLTATQPTPWVLTSNGNASVNGNTIFNGNPSNINIPGSGVTNIALGRTATQSADYSNPMHAASKAVDGNISGDSTTGSVSIANTSANAWWQVDLGSVQPITTIQVYGRTNCCTSQSGDYYVLVSDTPFSSNSLATTLNQPNVFKNYISGSPGVSTTTVNRTGRYVRIQLNKTDYLSLGEVQVFTSQTFSLSGLPKYTYDGGSAGPFFTTYSTMSGSSQTIAKPNSSISKLRKFVTTYTNEAATPPIGTSWYDHLKATVSENGTLHNFSTNNEVSVGNTQFPTGQSYSGNISTIFNIPGASGANINVNATGNIWLSPGVVCDVQSIIFISGNFRIAPGFTTTGNNLCMFVVKGNISIGTGTNGTTVPLTSSSQPNYDVVEASLVSDGYIWADNNPIGTASKGEGLYIRGSAVSSGALEWNRDLNTTANAFHPAVVIYNDPAYYHTFKLDLRTKEYSIREQK